MPILENARQEAFARAIATGASNTSAYRIAGYEDHAGNAHRLSVKEKVRSRIQELQQDQANSLVVSSAVVVSKLWNLAERCTSVEQDAETGEQTPSRFWNPNVAVRAYELIGRTKGLFVDNVNVNATIKDATSAGLLAGLTPDERVMIRTMLKAAAARQIEGRANEPQGLVIEQDEG